MRQSPTWDPSQGNLNPGHHSYVVWRERWSAFINRSRHHRQDTANYVHRQTPGTAQYLSTDPSSKEIPAQRKSQCLWHCVIGPVTSRNLPVTELVSWKHLRILAIQVPPMDLRISSSGIETTMGSEKISRTSNWTGVNGVWDCRRRRPRNPGWPSTMKFMPRISTWTILGESLSLDFPRLPGEVIHCCTN